MFAPPIERVLPEALSFIQSSRDAGVVRKLVAQVSPLLKDLYDNAGVGSQRLSRLLAGLAQEKSVRDYSEGSLRQLTEALRDDGIVSLLTSNPEIIERGLRSIPEENLREIAAQLDMMTSPPESRGPSIIRHRPLVDARGALVTAGTRDMPGELVSPCGDLLATWQEMLGSDSAIFERARNAGYVVQNAEGRWVRRLPGDPEKGEMIEGDPITEPQLRDECGDELEKYGIRDLPRGPEVERLRADFAGYVPDYMRNSLMSQLGLTGKSLNGASSPLTTQSLFLNQAGKAAEFFLYSVVGALLAFGNYSLSHFFSPQEVGFGHGTCFDAVDKVVELSDACRAGKKINIQMTQALPWQLQGMPLAALANLLGPVGDYQDKAQDVFADIVGRDMNPEVGARTLADYLEVTGACATGAMVLHYARKALLKGDRGEMMARLMILGASDAALANLAHPFISTGFGQAVASTETRLNAGLHPRQMSRPYDKRSAGLVIGEGGAALPGVLSFYDAVIRGIPYTSKVVATSVRLGQGGKRHEAGVNEGIVNALLSVFRTAWQSHGISPSAFKTVLAHGTSTGPSNIEETKALWHVLTRLGYKDQIDIYASKGKLAHGMGVSSFFDALFCLMIFITKLLPGLHNFNPDEIDEAITNPKNEKNGLADFRERINFSNQTRPYRGGPIVLLSEGFGSANAVVALDPEDVEHDLRMYSGLPRSAIEDYPKRKADHEAMVREEVDYYRRGRLSGRKILERIRYGRQIK